MNHKSYMQAQIHLESLYEELESLGREIFDVRVELEYQSDLTDARNTYQINTLEQHLQRLLSKTQEINQEIHNIETQCEIYEDENDLAR